MNNSDKAQIDIIDRIIEDCIKLRATRSEWLHPQNNRDEGRHQDVDLLEELRFLTEKPKDSMIRAKSLRSKIINSQSCMESIDHFKTENEDPVFLEILRLLSVAVSVKQELSR